MLVVAVVLAVVVAAVWVAIAVGKSGSCGTAGSPACGNFRAGGRQGPAAVFRVDQVGYPADGPKRAELMTSSSRATGAWQLVIAPSAAVAASGKASASLGSWSPAYPRVWAVTFSSVRQSGTYRLRLAGDHKVVSPWFRIGPATEIYAQAQANTVAFYQNERDGAQFISSALRTAPAHRNDSSAMTYTAPPVDSNGSFTGSLARFATGVRIDASGGWFDAGDYLKFTETTSYTVAAQLEDAALFPGTAARSGLTAEARFGLDFLQRMWDQRTKTLYYQVGIGSGNDKYLSDHDIWRLPQADDTYHGTDPKYEYIRHPPVFRAGPPGSPISPNQAGRLAADFALCYRVYRATDPGYAANCLREAETVYGLAGIHWQGKLLTAVPWDFYSESGWQDDMMLGAAELALALESARGGSLPAGLPVTDYHTYLTGAANWASQWFASKAAGQDTLNLYDVSALADFDLIRAMAPGPVGRLPVSRADLLANLRSQIDQAIGIAGSDPFGYGYAWNQWDTSTHGLGLVVMAAEYDALTGQPVYAAWEQRWLDAVLGANPWGVSLIVGDGTTFPRCLQHQVANLAGSLNGQPPVLAGAVVEGPNSAAATGTLGGMRPCQANAPGGVPYSAFNGHGAVFADNTQSYSTVEPAIDLTAISSLAFSWLSAAPASAGS